MNKELTPLEVSKQLKDFVYELELGNVDKLFVRGSFDIVEKALKVLKIIVEKNVQIKTLKTWNNTYKGKLTYQDYLGIIEDCDLGDKLTEEEFELVRKVILCIN